ncbi:hypothetical protein GCM10010441_36900 [Kitasatospora paracochleata]|uniref:Serine protease n=1 Tax=Kitasatospora paracochleata TaxID=58354 RepID=A0ABT1IYR1_9ACTN|nr:hypothetical protein [Kitasatospora paracochleata]MCP2310297.1 hypothetical protein [Kitasatospora paracochleata]
MSDEVIAADPAAALLRIRDLHGRLYGLGFLADRQGTVVTAHETVAGLPRVVLNTPGGQARVLGPDSIDLLPDRGLALLRTEAVGGLPGPALPIAADAGGRLIAVPHQRWEDGEPVLVQGGVLGRETVRYPHGEAFHLVEGALLLDVAGTPVAGAPVLDAETGAVIGVVAPRLRGGPEGVVRAAAIGGPAGGTAAAGAGAGAGGAAAMGDGRTTDVLAALLARNAAEVPAFGRALNLGGVLRIATAQLAAATAGPGRIADLAADRVDRDDGISGEEPQHPLTVLLGAAGSGRTTELAALAVRRAGAAHPLPTLWLRGADLAPGDRSLADTVDRALARAAGTLGVPAPRADAVAALCESAGRPLLVVLDAPEEAPLALGGSWLGAGTRWLGRSGARLLVACRPDGWEQLGGWHGDARLLWLGPLPPEAAVRASRRYGLPEQYLDARAAGHPLTVRLGGELHAAGVHGPLPGKGDAFAGWLDLACLRVARRVAAAGTARRHGAHRRGAPPPAAEDARQVRRLAAVAAGRLHEAARLMLGAGHGALGAAEFAQLFPVAGGWARAVLEERVLVAAGEGYRPGHEEWGEWLEAQHLDLDAALRLLLAEPGADGADGADAGDGRVVQPVRVVREGASAAGPGGGQEDGGAGDGVRSRGPVAAGEVATVQAVQPVQVVRAVRDGESTEGPDGAAHGVGRGRVGVVVAALGRVGEVRGAPALDVWLHRIRLALDRAEPGGDVDWWAGRLLVAGVAGSPEPAAHHALLVLLAERAGADPRFGPAFWAALPLTPAERLDLLRRLVPADPAFRTAAAELLTADPGAAVPLLCRWFDDTDPAVADLAEELLLAHRALALDELTEALVAAGHPRADGLLARLAEQEPSTLCRAVDRWSHDPRPERHVAAAVLALRTAPYASDSGRGLLRHAARTLLAREDEPALHGAALALLVGDPQSRAGYLSAALAAHRAGDPFLTPEVLAAAAADHPQEVLDALRARLTTSTSASAPGTAPESAESVGQVLRVLAGAAEPQVAGGCARLAAELLRERPELAPQIAGCLDRLLAAGHDARPLLADVLTAAPEVRSPFAAVLAAPSEEPQPAGTEAAVAVVGAVAGRARLLDTLLAAERDPEVLTAVLEALADGHAGHAPVRLCELLRRIAARWSGADEALVRCAGRVAGFARLLADWPEAGPPLPDGPALARMRALAGEGRDPQYAAAEAERRARHTETVPVPGQGRAHGTL